MDLPDSNIVRPNHVSLLESTLLRIFLRNFKKFFQIIFPTEHL